MNRTKLKTVVLSDIHLGTSHSKTKELCQFLESISCKKLILNGDIIDGWHLQKKNGKKNIWKKKHTDFFKVIIRMMERDGTDIIYIRGNQDDFLDSIAPFRFANIRILNYYILHSNDKKYFVTHGDAFDRITTGIRWLANKMMHGIHYLNSGDWVESLTALTEDLDGNWDIYHYDKSLIKFEEE